MIWICQAWSGNFSTLEHAWCPLHINVVFRPSRKTAYMYYRLWSSLQILRSVVLDDGTSRAGDLKSGSVLSRGFYHIKTTACVWYVYMLHVH